jgi:hypothetical protein
MDTEKRLKRKDKLEAKILKKMKSKKKNFDKLSPKERYRFNTIRQKIVGKKEFDYFEITEPGHGKKIFKKTVKEWDYKEYSYQKKHGTWVRDKYDELYIPGLWFRAIEKQEIGKTSLLYGMLESARSYLLTKIHEDLADIIDRKYPNIHIRPYGQKMFQKVKENSICKNCSEMTDYEIRSAGNEKILKEKKHLLMNLSRDIENDCIKLLKPYRGMTFRKYSEGKPEDQLDLFIIGGFSAAENIEFKTFFKDFVEKQQPIEYLDKIARKLIIEYKKRLKV